MIDKYNNMCYSSTIPRSIRSYVNKKVFDDMIDELVLKEISIEFGYPIHKIKRGTVEEMMELTVQYGLMFGTIEYKILGDTDEKT